MTCLLGIDSGGTKCDAVLVDDSGKMLGRGRCDRQDRIGARHIGGVGRADETVSLAVREALSRVEGIERLHVAGWSIDRLSLPESFSGSVVAHGVREQDAPMALAGVSCGVVVLAGTGAFCFGRTPDGRELLLDGIGPLYGDHGGAYQIGLAGVRACGRSTWEARFQTTLAEVIPAACKEFVGQAEPFDMVGYMLDARDRSEVASLAKLVDEECQRGDRIAKHILVTAADDMFETIHCVIDRLDIARDNIPLVGTGGVAVHSETYWSRICERVASVAPGLNPIRTKLPPVLGLILATAAQIGLDMNAFRSELADHQSDL
ncbi:MAG: BadF/BadG/BcrA/BcrD ATPase family protein [Fimbriimonas sp.]|nr:BadF/BadG/BcrA/BcrD ATPase family protein [Fimbriimonas sp.]